jgi:hypothetical protein
MFEGIKTHTIVTRVKCNFSLFKFIKFINIFENLKISIFIILKYNKFIQNFVESIGYFR